MGIEMKKPWYSLAEIKKYPLAVVTSLLLSYIVASTSYNSYKEAKLNARIQQVLDRERAALEKRNEFYEKMIFYKGEKERLENEQYESDSLVREKTQPFVDKILNHE